MCGIVGVFDRRVAHVEPERVLALARTLAHRGPDGEGVHVAGRVGFGHRRLSIIDLSLGKQPMTNEDGTIWITFNGEIYNFQQVRDELAGKGHLFRTHCDTEVIVHGYEEWGEDVVRRLRGMFAFGILDTRRQRLFLARDRAGVKPLVYFAGRDQFLFASEIKAIIADEDVPRDIDTDAVADYFECGYVPAPATVFRGIRKLLPGHTLTLDLVGSSEPTIRKYWDLSELYAEGPVATGEADAQDRILEMLREAVRIRMISDVPLGALLSGGIDSSAVATLMAGESPTPINTFSIGFREDTFTETQYSRVIAEQIRSQHYEQIVTADIRELLPRLVYHFDEPFADASAIPTYYVCRSAREQVTVCLSGDGADETFAGYDRYGQCLAQARLDFLPQRLRKVALGSIAPFVPSSVPGAGFVAAASGTPDERFLRYMSHQYGYLPRAALLSTTFRSQLQASRDGEPAFLARSINRNVGDTLARYLDLDFRTYLPNDILAKVDITSMMNSLEVRSPFLDQPFLEYLARMPSGLKHRDGKSKYILKKALRGTLPDGVLDRRKMGFGVPIRQWMSQELREMTRHYLLNSQRTSGVLDRTIIASMVSDNEAAPYRNPRGGKLWWCLFFEMWYQDVFAKPASVAA